MHISYSKASEDDRQTRATQRQRMHLQFPVLWAPGAIESAGQLQEWVESESEREERDLPDRLGLSIHIDSQ